LPLAPVFFFFHFNGGPEIPCFLVVTICMFCLKTQQDGEQQPLQKGDHVEYRAWKDSDGRMMAVRVERVKERPRPTGGGGGNRATQAHFR